MRLQHASPRQDVAFVVALVLLILIAFTSPCSADLNDNWSSAFGPPDLQAEGSTLGMSGSNVVIGGGFKQYLNLTAPYFSERIALWDGVGWQTAGSTGFPGAGAEVLATAVYNDELYAGGYFTTGAGAPANYIARFDAATSSWVPVESGSEPDGQVDALAVYGGKLYVGGEFTKMGTSFAANGIARWSPSGHWENIGNLEAGSSVGSVFALAVSGDGKLFVGGNFRTLLTGFQFSNTSGFGHIGTFDGSSWAKVADGASSAVHALRAVPGSNDIYVGGEFHSVQAGTTNSPSDLVARASATSGWTATYVSTDLQGTGEKVLSVETFQSTLYIGGTFSISGGSDIATRGSSSWLALAESPGGTVHAVTAMQAIGDTNLLVTGNFSTIGARNFNHIGRWTGSVWKRLGNGFRDNNIGGGVNAIAEDSGILYVGGTFTSAGDTTANRIALFNGAAWAALGTGITGGSSPEVKDVAVLSGNVYAGGTFTTAGGGSANNIAYWDGSSWHTLGSGTNDAVSAFAVFNSHLIVGGSFTSANSVSNTSHCAQWDGSAWTAIGNGLPADPIVALTVCRDTLYAASMGRHVYRYNLASNAWDDIGAVNTGGALYSLGAYPGGLVAGGNFSSIAGTTASNVARWNGASWVALSSGLDGIVWGLSGFGPNVVAVGEFSDHAKQWDGSAWTSLGSTPLDGKGRDIVNRGNDLYVVGDFWRAGGKPSVHIADFNQDITAPGEISDLAVAAVGRHSVALTWTFTGDDGSIGTATSYEVRYNTIPVSASSPGTLAVSGTPGASGTTGCTEIDNLSSCTSPYYFGVKMIDDAGNSSFSNSPSATTHCSGALATCGGNGPQGAQLSPDRLELGLAAAYPNPQNGSLKIEYSSTGESPVSIRVYDVAGRLIKNLVRQDERVGKFVATWDGKDEQGTQCKPGVYFYRMQAGTWKSEKRVVLLGH